MSMNFLENWNMAEVDGLVQSKPNTKHFFRCIKTAYYYHRASYFPCSPPFQKPVNIKSPNLNDSLRALLSSIYYDALKTSFLLFKMYFSFIVKSGGETSSVLFPKLLLN